MDERMTNDKNKSVVRLETALFELLSEKSYDEISITELCATAGVARKTFYRKFESMNEMLENAFTKVFRRLTAELNFAESDVRSIYGYCFEYLASHKEFTLAFVDPSLHKTVVTIIQRCVECAFDSATFGTVTSDPTRAMFIAPFIAEGLISIIRTWVGGGFKQSPKTLAALAERLLSGVLA